ncbi:hypothetical protein L1987_88841 [Smallanthus sonchifolius]|nr:hypothetical protein L1987_88841 [Smallanthus sonchifolius]
MNAPPRLLRVRSKKSFVRMLGHRLVRTTADEAKRSNAMVKGSDSGLMGDLARIIEFLRSWFRNRGINKDFVTGMQPSVKRAFLFVLRKKVDRASFPAGLF